MKHPVLAGFVSGALLLSGCQSLSLTAKNNKSAPDKSVAKAENVREIPWTWRKKKAPETKTELPPEFAQKLEDAKRRAASPKSAEEWIAEGSEHEVARNFTEAKKAYDEALRIDPVNVTAHHRLGILADMRQDFVVAQDHYEAALRQKPHDSNLLSDIGYSHHLQGHVQQSKRYLLQALDIDRQHRQALKNLGTLYASQGWYDEAALAFRHYRSEAEAQQLISQYFPNGRPIPGSDVALASGQRTAPPMPTDEEIDPNALKKMTQAEVMQLMQRQKLAAQKEREEKLLAEMRPPVQASPSHDPFASSQPPMAGPPRNGESPFDSHRAQPSNGDPFANRAAFQAEGSPPQAPSNRVATQDMPFWNGKGAQQTPVAQAPPPNWAMGSAGNSTAAPAQAPWWADGSSQPVADASGRAAVPPRPGLPSIDVPPGTIANQYGNSPSDPYAANPNHSPQNLSRQAYQLGMSAGPGTMFPTVANHPEAASSSPVSGPWSSGTAPGGYTEMKPPLSSDRPTNTTEMTQWQTAPTQPMPQSPADNWNSPSTVPWPGNNSVQPASGNVTGPRKPGQLMPVITPGPSPWGQASPSGSPRNGDSFNRSETDTDHAAETGTGVVPAWFDSRPSGSPPPTRPRGPAAQTTTVPQWPYAPK